MNFLFKFYHKTLGAHMHFRVFCGQETAPNITRNWSSAGDLCMREDEGQALLGILRRGSGDGGRVEIVEDK